MPRSKKTRTRFTERAEPRHMARLRQGRREAVSGRLGKEHALGLVRELHLGHEGNFPTFYSFLIIMAAAFLSAVFGMRGEPSAVDRSSWFLLGGMLLIQTNLKIFLVDLKYMIPKL